jgi:hypothetical protein
MGAVLLLGGTGVLGITGGCLESGKGDSGGQANLSPVFAACDRASGEVTCDVSVENGGEADSGGFRVDLFVDPGSEPSAPQRGDARQTMGNLRPGDVGNVSLSAACSGSCVVYVLVDAADVVYEWDEGDNLYGPDAAR